MFNSRSLALTVYSAENLRETGFTKQDPYCVVNVGDRMFKTKPDKSAGPSPMWNEELTSDVTDFTREVRFSIFNKNLLRKDDLIGTASLALKDISTTMQTVSVFDKNGDRCGDLQVSGVFTPEYQGDIEQSWPAPQATAARGSETGPSDIEKVSATPEVEETVSSTDVVPVQEDNVCRRETFTVMEDRPVEKERKEYFTEHHPVEREMVREVRTTGYEIPHQVTRDGGTFEERVVSEAVGPKCPAV